MSSIFANLKTPLWIQQHWKHESSVMLISAMSQKTKAQMPFARKEKNWSKIKQRTVYAF